MQKYNQTGSEAKSKLIELLSTSNHDLFDVRLNLPMQTRFIGKLNVSDEGTFQTSRKAKHLFRKTNSLGINYKLLTSEEIKFKWIIINYQNRKLVTSRSYFIEKGQTFQFNQKGFELQVFLPIDEFGVRKARQYEKEKEAQTEIFTQPKSTAEPKDINSQVELFPIEKTSTLKYLEA